MKHLVIIGAGGFGREMFCAAREAIGYGTVFDIKGFLDDRLSALDGFSSYAPVISSLETYKPCDDDVFITALGNIATRKRCSKIIEERGGKFISIIHHTASLGCNVTVGEGSFIAHNAVLTADISVGRHACVFQNTTIGHDSRLGDYTHVYAQCSIGGGVKIKDGAAVYPRSCIVPRRTIGSNAVVGAGSVVFVSVTDGKTVFGCPAVVMDMPI